MHEGGFDNYTDEQLKNVEAEIDDMINNYLESAREDAVERGEADPDKYAQEALEKLFADSDLSRQKLIDEQLVVEMEKRGYKVARRTIAKYRGQLGIPLARWRKEL